MSKKEATNGGSNIAVGTPGAYPFAMPYCKLKRTPRESAADQALQTRLVADPSHGSPTAAAFQVAMPSFILKAEITSVLIQRTNKRVFPLHSSSAPDDA